MKLGIFGGTFNPIHKSHIYLAEEFKKNLLLDFVLLMPTYTPPHKEAKDLAGAEERFAMCQLAVEGKEGFLVSDYEIKKQGKSYTYETLEWLHSRCPEAEIYLLMGSDMYLTMELWKNARRIYELSTLCVIARESHIEEELLFKEKELEKKGAKSIFLQVNPHPMSSTDIREKIMEGQSVTEFLPTTVDEYIRTHKLYKGWGETL